MTTEATTTTTSAAATIAASTPPPAATTTTTTEATTTAAADWTAGLNEGHKGFVQLKGFKGPSDVLESYQGLEKLIGVPKERVLKLPEKSDAPEWNDIYARLGRPEKPEGYKIPESKAMGDPEFAKNAANWFHEAGLTATQAEKVAAKLNQYAETRVGSIQTEYAQKVEADAQELKREWGMAHDQNVNLAKQAMTGLGITPEQVDGMEKAMGFAGVMKFMHVLGSKIGEAQYVNGKPAGLSISTPQGAQAMIKELTQDEGFRTKYLSGDMEAKQKMDQLHRMAYPQESQGA